MSKRSVPWLTPILLCALPVLGVAKAPAPNTGDIDLNSRITMNVQIAQEGGACAPGYRWNTTYGGCRRAALERNSQSDSCGADYTGEQTRTRERTQYLLQSTGQAANDPWGDWSAWDRSQCVAAPRRLAGTIRGGIVQVVGDMVQEYAYSSAYPPPGGSPAGFYMGSRRTYSSIYGVTLDRTSAQLQCLFGTTTTDGSGENSAARSWGWLLAPGVSIQTEHGHCQVSQNNTQVHLFGDCDTEANNDWGGCLSAARTVSVVDVSPCSATIAVSAPARFPYPVHTVEHVISLCS